MTARPAGDYGIDAPGVPWGWGIATAASLVAAVVFGLVRAEWSLSLCIYFAVLTILGAAGTILYLRASLVGKFEVWRKQIAALSLRGDERVLDLGCGHGTVAVLLAEQLPHGKVTGIDLWRSVDQSGNTPDAARRNALLNGVDARINFDTGDMTALPYADSTFDVVTASLAIHNIRSAESRALAVREAIRVLRPGGQLVVVDIQRVRDYETVARESGLVVHETRSLGWRMWWTGPWFPTRLLTAAKTG